MKLLKLMFKIMWFTANALWFLLISIVIYCTIEYQVEKLIRKHRKKKESQEMAEEMHEKKEPEDA